jgi:hypothetical protein
MIAEFAAPARFAIVTDASIDAPEGITLVARLIPAEGDLC